MPLCKNDPKKTYKGNEPSPKGLGYCAHSEKIGVVRKGLDGNKWIISTTSKGIKRWVKYKIEKKIKKDSVKHMFSNLNKKQLKIIDLLKNEVKNELKAIGVKLMLKKLELINGWYIIDYVWPESGTYNINKDKFIIVVLRLDKNNKLYVPDGELDCQHHGIVYKTKKDVIEIFKKYFGNKFKWDGKQQHILTIKF